MINNIISWHTIIIINLAVAMSFIITRVIFKLPMLNSVASKKQQLLFCKISLLIALITVIASPRLMSAIIISHSNKFQLQPIMTQATTGLFQNHAIMNAHNNISNILPPFLSFDGLLKMICIIGFIIALFQYLKSMLYLNKISREAFVYKQINNVMLLVSHTITVPFCWSVFNKHYILIPEKLLDNHQAMILSIRHEFQHLWQGDTYWQHFFWVLKLICFFNPFFRLWKNWIGELQEFSCDEALILKQMTNPIAYADCLLTVAKTSYDSTQFPQLALGMFSHSKKNHTSILQRRILMLFNYKSVKVQYLRVILLYIVCFFAMSTMAYALNNNTDINNMTQQQLNALIQQSDLSNLLQVSAVPEVVTEINNIRASQQARNYMSASLERMQAYKTMIQQQFKNNGIPNDLLVLPLVESGYQSLNAKINPLNAAGIWQFIPSTAARFNLVINQQRDDRLDPQLATQAAVNYLNNLYAQFHNWRLVAIAYEIGEAQTQKLIKITGSRDPWILARSFAAPNELKKYLATLDAAVIIMHNPSLIS